MMLIQSDFYLQDDVVKISRDLIGKYLLTCFDGIVSGGKIIETEAYKGPEDKASHAYNYRRTKRNEVMYNKGGVCYVYLCYGIHSLFNIVTNSHGIPHAVLIRAIEPEIGREHMLERRKKEAFCRSLSSGPGSLTQALGIHVAHNGLGLHGPEIWLEDRGVKVTPDQILARPRVGIDYAGEDALLPWRFILLGSSK